MIVLDTNVLSESLKVEPSPVVAGWISLQPGSTVFTTSITQAELLFGIQCMPTGHRRSALNASIVRMLAQVFPGRILPFDSNAAEFYALIAAKRRGMGRPISEADAQIAAIALSHGAALASRNARDFEHCGIRIINPWDSPLP